MTLPGKFGVSTSGAASYTILIAVPPGTAGMSPSLSLEYNSQSSIASGWLGSGVVGVSWSLGGLPAVGRCPRTIAQDGVSGAVNYDANDKFCLDGQRLIAISGTDGADGTEYRTEIESFSRVISHGTAGTGPAWFEVHTKSGQVLQFGNTTDSRILALGKPTARSWGVNKVSDTKGNYYTVTYVNDTVNGQAYPSRIDYTANDGASLAPYNSVQFVYDTTRTDVMPVYHVGALLKTTVRLTNVKTYAGAALVSDYRLAYQQGSATSRSQLASVTLCDGSGNCLPATTFGWSAGGNSTFTQVQNAINSWTLGSPPTTNYTPLTSDFNNDGKTDVAMIGGSNVYMLNANGDGTFAQVQAGMDGWNFGSPPTTAYVPVVGDFNGDGRTDMAMIGAYGIYSILNTSNGSVQVSYEMTGGWSFSQPPQASYLPLAGDFNGDGKTDIAIVSGTNIYLFTSNGDGSFTQLLVPMTGWSFGTPPSSTVTPVVGDFNGDGKTDIALIGSATIWMLLSNGNGTFTQVQNAITGSTFSTPPTSSYSPVAGDFNGDGQTDIAVIGSTSIWLFLSKGDGTFAQTQVALTGWTFGTPPTSSYVPTTGDFNGDGRADIALIGSTSIYLLLSKGDGTFTQAQNALTGWSFGTPPTTSYTPLSGDFNGDGKTDLMLLGSTTEYVLLANGSAVDVLTSISTGLGASTSIIYLPLTNASVYSHDSGSVYPLQDVEAPIYVVSRVDTPNGAGGTYSTTYNYVGAKSDASGRGFLGFRQMVVTDLQTNVVQTTTYRQDYPYLNVVASETQTVGSTTLSSTTNTHSSTSLGGTRYQVFLTQSQSSKTDLDGTPLPTATSSYQYDAYNNATQVTVTTSDGYSKTTTNTYTNDTTNWLLGRLTASSVTSQAAPQLGPYCALPWGGSVADGQSVTAYSSAPPAGQTCNTVAQTRTCTRGTLSGSYNQQTCKAVCALPWGGTISQGQTVTAYSASNVPAGQTCSAIAQVRTCGADGVLTGSNSFQGCVVIAPVRIYLTTGSSWTVPSDWNSSNNSIEVIGGGGGSGAGTFTNPPANAWAGGGGGGGAYSKITNATLSSGSAVSYQVGAAGSGFTSASGTPGGDTYFCNISSNCSSISGSAVIVGAKGGGAGLVAPSGAGGVGGAAASGVGAVKYSGGNGVRGVDNGYGGAGGGAGGPNGAGANGSTTTGGNGDAGSGGAGHSGAGPGGNGTEWDYAHGSGGGGGTGVANCTSCTGGLYGGGAGASVSGTTSGAAGGQGIIVITYLPVPPGQYCALPWGGALGQGQSVTAYSAPSVSIGQQCSALAQTRTCGAGGVLSGGNSYQTCIAPTPVKFFLTSGTGWRVPANWNNSSNSVEVIGGGGAGGSGMEGGGGGGYSKISNLAISPGTIVSLSVGAGGVGGNTSTYPTLNYGTAGGDTYFNGTSCAGSSVCAKGGGGGTYNTATNGGAASSGVGTVKYSGGLSPRTYGNSGAGGGGAAGPYGNGVDGMTSAGSLPDSGGPGDEGYGGAAGAGGSGSGLAGSEWDLTHGSGGGGGGGTGQLAQAAPGGPGGAFGGGGGGGSFTTSGSIPANGSGGNGAPGLIVVTYTPVWPVVTVYLTAGSTWTVPNDWNSGNNSIEVIGGGGGSGAGTFTNPPANAWAGGGGGGGAYSKITNAVLTTGSVLSYQVGAAGGGFTSASGTPGGDTYFCNASSNCSSISDSAVIVGAKGGGAGLVAPSGAGGVGGAAASGVGAVKYAGGNGVRGVDNGYGGAGGGAGGPSGAGANGSTTTGGNGDAGLGGAGHSGAGAGGNGFEWDSSHGSGGGGGTGVANCTSCTGGLFGAGAGASVSGTTSGAAGGQGIIVITYTPGG